jgi:peptidoglycan hydrolase CwlO-like protein
MLKILASVEEQFTRLRAAKKSQDDALSAMAERNRLLHQADQELRQMRQDLRQQQEMLQHDRDRFVADPDVTR